MEEPLIVMSGTNIGQIATGCCDFRGKFLCPDMGLVYQYPGQRLEHAMEDEDILTIIIQNKHRRVKKKSEGKN